MIPVVPAPPRCKKYLVTGWEGGGDLDRESETRTVAAPLELPLLADGRFGRGPESSAVGLEGDGLELRELGRAAARVLRFVELAGLDVGREAACQKRHGAVLGGLRVLLILLL